MQFMAGRLFRFHTPVRGRTIWGNALNALRPPPSLLRCDPKVLCNIRMRGATHGPELLDDPGGNPHYSTRPESRVERFDQWATTCLTSTGPAPFPGPLPPVLGGSWGRPQAVFPPLCGGIGLYCRGALNGPGTVRTWETPMRGLFPLSQSSLIPYGWPVFSRPLVLVVG